MANETKHVFIPWAEYLPDQKYFENQGLLVAEGVVPVYGDYFQSPGVNNISSLADWNVTGNYFGLHAHPKTAAPGWTMYGGTANKIWEMSATGTRTDRSGAAYATPGTDSGVQFTSYGDSVIETRYVSPPNILLPGAGAFAALHTATFAPAAKFCCVVRSNLVLANCTLPAPYDGLAAGANPQLVAWAATDAPRSFGSLRADPQLVGAGYQPLNNDFGPITGMVASDDAGIIFQARGVVRMDGPPYTFGAIIRGHGCRYPNSIVLVGSDIYFWGDGGPSVIRNGGKVSVLQSLQAQVVVLGKGKITRSIIDNVTGFGPHSIQASPPPIYVSGYADLTNGLVFWAYTTVDGAAAGQVGDQIIAYNYDEDRFSTFTPLASAGAQGVSGGALFLRQKPDTGDAWLAGRNGVFVERNLLVPSDLISSWQYNNGGPISLGTGFMQLDPTNSTRIIRVRPVYSVPASASLSHSLTVATTSDPAGAASPPATSGPFTTFDSSGNGWLPTPGSKFGDFHALLYSVGVSSNSARISNLKGLEVIYEVGGDWT